MRSFASAARRSLRRVLPLSIAASAVLSGCFDERHSEDPFGPKQANAVAAAVAATERADLSPIPWFVIGPLQFTAPMTLGSPITVTARFQALKNTGGADLDLIAPEIEVARLTNWTRFQIPVGLRVPSAASDHGRLMQAGQDITLTGTIVIKQPGYYRIAARAVKTSNEVAVTAEGVFQDLAYLEKWLLLTETTALVTDTYDPSVIPREFVPQPGPFQPAPSSLRKASADQDRKARPLLASLLPSRAAILRLLGANVRNPPIVIQARFFNPNTLTYTPLANALVSVMIHSYVEPGATQFWLVNRFRRQLRDPVRKR